MSQKRRVEGSRHPDAWSPELVWQLLRRAERYRKCIDSFAKHCPQWDPMMNFYFEEVSKESSKIKGEWKRDRDKYFEIPIKNRERLKKPDDLLKGFLAMYGDVLRFPIHYKTERPQRHYLNALWNFRPATIVDSRHLDDFKCDREHLSNQFPQSSWQYEPEDYFGSYKNIKMGKWPKIEHVKTEKVDPDEHPLFRMVHLNFEINTTFSDETIQDEIKRALNVFLPMIRLYHDTKLTKATKIRWDLIKYGLEAWDLRKEEPALTDYAIAQKIKFTGEDLSSRQKFDRVREILPTVKKLIEYFDWPASWRGSDMMKKEADIGRKKSKE